MDFQDIIDKYTNWIEFSKMKYSLTTWICIVIGATFLTGLLSYVITTLLIREFTLIPIAFSLATFVLLLGYPYMKNEAIIDSIEKNFSDSLKQMADTLKAGDTYESALREVVEADYGRLSEEMSFALRRLEDGENIETALTGFANRIDSRLVKRTVTIILDSIKSGASLAEILDEIAEDVRDFQRLKEERKSNTTMQFMFMIASAGFVAPLIFGEINAVVGAFSTISAGSLTPEQIIATDQTNNFIILLIQIYLIIEVTGSGTMMSLIREGKLNKSIIYIPLLLLAAFIMYYIASFVVKGMISGAV
ncbi:MAG: type II secretion system F family protein [archaeon]|jgi:flagellar protein FlaJ